MRAIDDPLMNEFASEPPASALNATYLDNARGRAAYRRSSWALLLTLLVALAARIWLDGWVAVVVVAVGCCYSVLGVVFRQLDEVWLQQRYLLEGKTRALLCAAKSASTRRVFLRVHRSYIVNTRHIRQIKPLLKGEYAVVLSDGTIIDTGRTYRDAIEAFLQANQLDGSDDR